MTSSTMNINSHHNATINYTSSSYDTLHDEVWKVGSGGGGGVMNFLIGVTPTPHEYGKRRIEFDYIYIFYILVVINILVLLPSCTRYIIKQSYAGRTTRRCNKSKKKELMQKDDNNNNNNNNNNNISSQQKQQLAHTTLLYTYLPAYLLATCADWLQGPYKYALYTGYGYTQREIAHLFVAGYGSGMILGSVIGGLADIYGRKRLCICYCFSYTISVLLKHFKCYTVLLVGRIFGGIATSLLFSVFDSWFICAHGQRGLAVTKNEEERYIAKSLSISTYGSSVVAIMSGVIANRVVAASGTIRPMYSSGVVGVNDNNMLSSHIYVGGYISAFDACLVPLTLCAMMILLFWEENYGESMEVRKDKKSLLSLSLSSNSNGDCSLQTLQRRTTSIVRKDSSTIFEDDEQIVQADDDDDDDDDCKTTAENSEYAMLRTTVIEIDQDEDYDSTSIARRKQQQSNSNSGRGMFSNLLDGVYTVWNSTEILICCIVGSVFEGIMYIFIFLWTPTLTSLQMKLDVLHDISVTNSTAIIEQSTTTSTTKDMHHGEGSDLPFGWIFSTFMVSCMLGTIAFSRLSHAGISASKCLVGVLAVASLSCLAMSRPLSSMTSTSTSSANTSQYIGMLVYEFCEY